MNPRHRIPCPLLCVILLLLLAPSGCRRFHAEHHGDYVYVIAKQTFLRDRVAAVSNKTATVYNGERLEVVDQGRRFLKVKTEVGSMGWLEEHMIIDQDAYDKFKALHDAQLTTVAVSTAVLRDDLYAHLMPGRDTAHFLLLPEGDKLQLLQRASVPRPDAQAAWMKPVQKASTKASPASAATKTIGAVSAKAAGPTKVAAPVAPIRKPAAAPVAKVGRHGRLRGRKVVQDLDPNAVPMEDWWLVRDGSGRIGWVLARRLDVDVPDEVVQYAEGQRIVGAYLLNKVSDSGATAKFPDGNVPNYVAVLSPYKDGLPYDYDQVRVFAWNVKKHRYEGAYRKRDIAGYLPVTVSQKVVETTGPLASTPVPVFTIKVATDTAIPSLDAQTGLINPVATEQQTFSLEGEMVKRLLPPSAAPAPRPVAAPSTAATPRGRRARHHAVAVRHRHRHA